MNGKIGVFVYFFFLQVLLQVDNNFGTISLKESKIRFRVPKKEHPVISANIPKLPPKLANLSQIEYLASIKTTSGSKIRMWTINKFFIMSSYLILCFGFEAIMEVTIVNPWSK